VRVCDSVEWVRADPSPRPGTAPMGRPRSRRGGPSHRRRQL